MSIALSAACRATILPPGSARALARGRDANFPGDESPGSFRSWLWLLCNPGVPAGVAPAVIRDRSWPCSLAALARRRQTSQHDRARW